MNKPSSIYTEYTRVHDSPFRTPSDISSPHYDISCALESSSVMRTKNVSSETVLDVDGVCRLPSTCELVVKPAMNHVRGHINMCRIYITMADFLAM